MTRNFAQIRDILYTEFSATQPFPANPYIFQVQLPRGMGIKRLEAYLQPGDAIRISEEKLGRAKYIYVDVDEFDAVVVDPRTPITGFSVKPWDAMTCIKVQSLPGEFAEPQVHAVQNVWASKFTIGEQVRVRKLYGNGTDYGRRCLVNDKR